MNKIIIFLMLSVTQCFGQAKNESNVFEGDWKVSCKQGSGFIQINKDYSILMEVNSNQIYISCFGIKKVYDEYQILEIFLIEPDDLGHGGMNLNWNFFSKNKMIGKLLFNNEYKMEFEWFGFYNDKKKKYEWVDNIDFILSDNKNYPVCLEKCNK